MRAKPGDRLSQASAIITVQERGSECASEWGGQKEPMQYGQHAGINTWRSEGETKHFAEKQRHFDVLYRVKQQHTETLDVLDVAGDVDGVIAAAITAIFTVAQLRLDPVGVPTQPPSR